MEAKKGKGNGLSGPPLSLRSRISHHKGFLCLVNTLSTACPLFELNDFDTEAPSFIRAISALLES